MILACCQTFFQRQSNTLQAVIKSCLLPAPRRQRKNSNCSRVTITTLLGANIENIGEGKSIYYHFYDAFIAQQWMLHLAIQPVGLLTFRDIKPER